MLSTQPPAVTPCTPRSRQGRLGEQGRASPEPSPHPRPRQQAAPAVATGQGRTAPPGRDPVAERLPAETLTARSPEGDAGKSPTNRRPHRRPAGSGRAGPGRTGPVPQLSPHGGADSPLSLPAAALPWRRCGQRKSRAASRSWKWPKGTRAHDMVPPPPPNPETAADFPHARRRAALRRAHARRREALFPLPFHVTPAAVGGGREAGGEQWRRVVAQPQRPPRGSGLLGAGITLLLLVLLLLRRAATWLLAVAKQCPSGEAAGSAVAGAASPPRFLRRIAAYVAVPGP